MRKFEIGKRYNDGSFTFEIVKRTAKTVTYVKVIHAGRFNEKKDNEEKRAKILDWDTREVFIVKDLLVEA